MSNYYVLPELQQARFYVSHKFPLIIGEISSTLKYQEDNGVDTLSTDGFTIFYNKHYFLNLKEDDRNFIVLHEILHTVFFHPAMLPKDGNYIDGISLWNIAADYVVNGFIVDVIGMPLCEYAVYNHDYKGKTVEWIYEELNIMYKQKLSNKNENEPNKQVLEHDSHCGEKRLNNPIEKNDNKSWQIKIVRRLAVSKFAKKLKKGEGFFVLRGHFVKLKTQEKVDLLDWLFEQGIKGGCVLGGYSIAYTKAGGQYLEKLTFFKKNNPAF